MNDVIFVAVPIFRTEKKNDLQPTKSSDWLQLVFLFETGESLLIKPPYRRFANTLSDHYSQLEALNLRGQICEDLYTVEERCDLSMQVAIIIIKYQW